jgi:hypothetical protein
MKFKLARRVMSRAMGLLHPAARDSDHIAALVRQRSFAAARECSKLGSDTDPHLQSLLKEFLAFFSVLAVNEIAIRSGERSGDALERIYKRLVTSVSEAYESSSIPLRDEATVRRLINENNAAFDHWFYGYWNADFAGMRVTPRDLAQLGEIKRCEPAKSYGTDAALILLARVAKLESADESIPDPSRVQAYDRVIQQHVASFGASLTDTSAATAAPVHRLRDLARHWPRISIASAGLAIILVAAGIWLKSKNIPELPEQTRAEPEQPATPAPSPALPGTLAHPMGEGRGEGLFPDFPEPPLELTPDFSASLAEAFGDPTIDPELAASIPDVVAAPPDPPSPADAAAAQAAAPEPIPQPAFDLAAAAETCPNALLFRQIEPEQRYRPNLNSPPLPRVLPTFALQQTGTNVEIIDWDKSVYKGSIQSAATAGAPAELYQLHASGTNRTLNQLVIFTANFTRPGAASEPDQAGWVARRRAKIEGTAFFGAGSLRIEAQEIDP